MTKSIPPPHRHTTQYYVALFGLLSVIASGTVAIILAMINKPAVPASPVSEEQTVMFPTPSISLATRTPPPPPLVEIFPQSAGGGDDFVFANEGGTLTPAFVPSGICIHSGSYGLQLTYDMKLAGHGGWGVHWDQAPGKHYDASSFSSLTFWTRGLVGNEIFQIGLKDTDGKEVKVESVKLISEVTDWMMVTAPLSKFNGVNLASLNNLSFGFNRNHGAGSICIDDIAFLP